MVLFGVSFLVLGATGYAETIAQTVAGNLPKSDSLMFTGIYPDATIIQGTSQQISATSFQQPITDGIYLPTQFTWTLDGQQVRTHYGTIDYFSLSSLSVGTHTLVLTTSPNTGSMTYHITVKPNGSMIVGFNTLALIGGALMAPIGGVIFVKTKKR